MLTNILDKYTKVLEGTNNRYDDSSFPSFNNNKIINSKLLSLSHSAHLYFYKFSHSLEYHQFIRNEDCWHMLKLDLDIIDTTKTLRYKIINELLSIDFLVRCDRNEYYLNFAYVHKFNKFQLKWLQRHIVHLSSLQLSSNCKQSS